MKKNNFSQLITAITKFFKLTISIFLFVFWILNSANGAKKILITVNQFVSHPALDAAKNGLEKAFNDRNLSDQIELKISNAQGNIVTNAQIAKHQAALSPNFMVAIATPAAQSIYKNLTDKSTLAFVAVTDPEAAGIKELPNVIGVSDQPPIEELLQTIVKILPKAQNIGVIYNSGEVNSVKMVQKIKELASSINLKIIEAVLTNSRDAKQATQKLVGSVDFIYIPQDNLVVSSLDSIIAVTNKVGIPVISNDPSLNEKGLLLSYGCNYFQSGEQLGNMIADLIEGKKLATNTQSSNIKNLKINDPVAQKLGVSIPVGVK